MADPVANPETGAAPETTVAADEPKSELSVEQQIAGAIDLGEEEPKQTPKKEDSKKSDEKEGDKPQPDSDDNEEDDDADSEDDADSDSNEDSDEDNSDDEDEKEPEFKTLEELAEAAEMSVDDIKALFKGKIKVQGKEVEVSFDDLLKGQMLESDYRLKTSSHAENVRTFDAHKAEATELMRTQVQESISVLQALTQEFIGENKNINWEELKMHDPTEYNLRRTETTDKAHKLDSWKAKLQAHNDRVQAQSKEKDGVEFGNYQATQAENIKRLIPAWIDSEVANRESGEIRHWLKTSFDADMGFTDSEIDNLTDARVVSIMRKAMQLDNKSKKADHIKKKVKGTRKILKSKAKGPKKSQKKAQQDRKSQAARSGKQEDAASAILNML